VSLGFSPSLSFFPSPSTHSRTLFYCGRFWTTPSTVVSSARFPRRREAFFLIGSAAGAGQDFESNEALFLTGGCYIRIKFGVNTIQSVETCLIFSHRVSGSEQTKPGNTAKSPLAGAHKFVLRTSNLFLSLSVESNTI